MSNYCGISSIHGLIHVILIDLSFNPVFICVSLQPLRRVTFSVVNQAPDQGCYDSGVEDSETPSSKSSSGPRLGSLPLPEDGYERTTPEGSVGEEEHVENGKSSFVETGR